MPQTQANFRMRVLQEIDARINRAAGIALASYSDDVEAGWTRHRIDLDPGTTSDRHTIVLTAIYASQKAIEVAIRGTASFDDLMIDLEAKAVLDDIIDVPVHSGFRLVASRVYAFIRERFAKEIGEGYTFRLYGHSLGGAAASVVSMYLHQTDVEVDLVVTFGAPRFTTNEGARKYQVLNQRTYRIVRCDDAIPFLPPPNFFGWSTESYQSNGNLLLLLAPPYFDYSIGIDIERDFIHQLRTEFINGKNRQAFVFGHRMDSYRHHVNALTELSILQRNRRSSDNIFGGVAAEQLTPVSYSLRMQKALCPPKLLPR